MMALSAAASWAKPAAAQELRGTVLDSASHQPISGAVLMLLDSSGVMLIRRITDEHGQYRIALSATARWARVVRIGFKPQEIPLPDAAAAAKPFDLVMAPVPTMLAAVRVRDQSRCSRRNDRATALGLWEQARDGLLATVVSRETNTATVHRLMFERSLDGASDKVTRFLVGADSATGTAKSFNASHSAKDFVAKGFSADSAGDQSLYGPDAETLLDDAFASGYCFRLADPAKSRPNQVGLAFAPASGDRPRDRIDIDGTLWVDTAARALRDIEYRYVGMPSITDEYRPGGRISFRQMPNGSVMIDQWYIRGVSATRDTIDVVGEAHERSWLFAAESGGELARAEWPDGESWHASLGTLRVHVAAPVGEMPRATTIALPGTHYRGTSDANGEMEIGDLEPGPYTIEIVDPRLAKIGLWMPTPIKFVAARDSVFRVTLKAPTAESWVANKCVTAGQWEAGDSVFVIGRVLTGRGTPVANAKVTFAFQTDAGLWTQLPNYYTTGTDGVFQSCSRMYEVGRAVKMRVARQGMAPVETLQPIAANLTALVVRVPAAPQPALKQAP
jgi:hypothetical protein